MAYESAVGAARVLRDDEHDPLDPCGIVNLDPARYEQIKPTSLGAHAIVHGHFNINRYERIPGAFRVVMLREPVQNVMSIYYYWRGICRKGDPKYRGHCLYRYFCRTQPSLLEFAALPAIRWLMTGVYFRDVNMDCFDVIGDHVDADAYLQRVANLTGINLGRLPRINVTEPSDERQAALEDTRCLSKLRDLLADDLRFYERYCGR
jgi:hypothetical protein